MKADRDEVKRAYLDSEESMAAIAKRFDVSSRTVERWAKNDPEGDWFELRKAKGVVSKVVSINVKPKPKTEPTEKVRANYSAQPRRSHQRGELDEMEIIESAIASLSMLLTGMNARGEDVPVDTRGIGSTAGALVRLLEYRRKINPPTAVELTEQALALGISPNEFIAELKAKWEPRQRA